MTVFDSGRRRRDRNDRDRENIGELERARRRREDDEDEYDRPVRSKLIELHIIGCNITAQCE